MVDTWWSREPHTKWGKEDDVEVIEPTLRWYQERK